MDASLGLEGGIHFVFDWIHRSLRELIYSTIALRKASKFLLRRSTGGIMKFCRTSKLEKVPGLFADWVLSCFWNCIVRWTLTATYVSFIVYIKNCRRRIHPPENSDIRGEQENFDNLGRVRVSFGIAFF